MHSGHPPAPNADTAQCGGGACCCAQPAFVGKKWAIHYLGSTVWVKRALFWDKLKVVEEGGQGSLKLICRLSVVALADQIRAGVKPPLMPSEIKAPKPALTPRKKKKK
jgi:hypothetical protein